VNAWVAGAAAAGISYVYTQRSMFQSTAQLLDSFPGSQQFPVSDEKAKEPLFGPTFRAESIKKWNKGVEFVFGGIASALAKRGL